MGDGLLTVAQAAVRSGCSERMLRRAMNAGDLEAVRLGAGPKSDSALVPQTAMQSRLSPRKH